MGRAKLPMKQIALEKNRNITFKKRRNGLKKKVYEFSTLCDVQACMICFGSKQDQETEAVTWPEERWAVEGIIQEYQSRSKEEQDRRKSDLSTYLCEQMKKAEEELQQLRQTNATVLYPSWDPRLDSFSEDHLRELASSLEAKKKMVSEKIEYFLNDQHLIGWRDGGVAETEINLSPFHQNYNNNNNNMMEVLSPTNQSNLLNYKMDMNMHRFEMVGNPHLDPPPISYMRPPTMDTISDFIHQDVGLFPNISHYFGDLNYSNNNSSNLSSLPSFQSTVLPPSPSGYGMPAKKEFNLISPYGRVESREFMNMFSNSNQQPISFMGPSSSFNSLMMPQPLATLPQSFSPIVNQMGDVFWQSPNGGNY